MKKMKRFLAALIVAVLAFSATACKPKEAASGPDVPAAGASLKVGVCIYKYADTYMSSVRQAIENAAQGSTDVELLMNDSKGDQGVQNDQIDIMIQKGVNALAINLVDIGAAPTVIDKAKEAGIPIVFFNREPATADIQAYDKARFIGTKPEEAGIIQGEVMTEIWNGANWDKNGDGKMQYVMLIGDPDNPEAQARTKFSIDTFAANGFGVEMLGEQVANWDSDKANTAMAAWLAREGDKIEFVVANNDGMASGAIAALNAEGYNIGDGGKYIPVVGVDATDEAIALINGGKMSGTVKQDAVGMGDAVFALAHNVAAGKDFLDGTSYKYDETGVAIRIPYQPFMGVVEAPEIVGNYTVGVCIYKYDDTYMSSVRQAIETASKDYPNVELLMNDSKGDQGVQNDQVDIMIQKGVNALAINLVDIGAAPTVIDKAKEAGIPIVFFNREPSAKDIAAYDKARFIGTKPEEAGIIQGELMLDIWKDAKLDKNGDGKMQYVMLIGDPDNPEAQARTKFSIDTVVAGGVTVDKLGEQVANWDSDKANTAMAAWLAREGDKIEFVVANNDGMASGAIAALNAEGYNTGDGGKFIPVVGVDATDEAIALINGKKMSGTVKQDAVGMGNAVFTLVSNAAAGNDFLAGTSYKYDETGNAIRIPYQPFMGN